MTTIEGLFEAVFAVESAPRLYSEDHREVGVQCPPAWDPVTSGLSGVECVTTEAEEYPVLEAVAREWLLKT
jgi:hypothetical protein